MPGDSAERLIRALQRARAQERTADEDFSVEDALPSPPDPAEQTTWTAADIRDGVDEVPLGEREGIDTPTALYPDGPPRGQRGGPTGTVITGQADQVDRSLLGSIHEQLSEPVTQDAWLGLIYVEVKRGADAQVESAEILAGWSRTAGAVGWLVALLLGLGGPLLLAVLVIRLLWGFP